MKFCESCNYLIYEGEVCPTCGRKKHVREVRDEDFCFFADLSDVYFGMFEYTLKENGIDAVGVQYYPYGVHPGNVGRASGRHVFVRYKDLETARELYNILFGTDDGNGE